MMKMGPAKVSPCVRIPVQTLVRPTGGVSA